MFAYGQNTTTPAPSPKNNNIKAKTRHYNRNGVKTETSKVAALRNLKRYDYRSEKQLEGTKEKGTGLDFR